MGYELTNSVRAAIKSMLPNKPRGVALMYDRRVLTASFRDLRSGSVVDRRAVPPGFALLPEGRFQSR